MKRIAFMLLILSSLGSLTAALDAAGKRDPLSLSLSAAVVHEAAQVSVRVRIEPDARSRLLAVEWWSDEGAGGAHDINLEGDRSALRHEYPIKRLEAGNYVVTAILVRDDGSQVRRTARLIVVAEGARLPSPSAPGLGEFEAAPID